jgi:hypothetical protein
MIVKYMQNFNLAVVGALVLSVSTVAIAAPRLSSASKAQIDGIGAVRVGMTVKQAAKAAGVNLVPSYNDNNNECRYVHPQSGLKNLEMMVSKDRIVRIDIDKGSSIKTLKGAGVGDSEARIKSLYRGRIEVSPHKYTNGHYLTFVPADRADKHRIVFETDGRKVLNYRVGKLPDVEYIEGCS